MGPTAQNAASFLQWDVRFYGDGIGTNDWPAGTSLTLDFPTFSISGRARTDSPPRGKFATSPWLRGALRATAGGPDLLPCLALGEGALGAFATVAVRVTCGVDSLKADPRGGFSTWNRSRAQGHPASGPAFSLERRWAFGFRLRDAPPASPRPGTHVMTREEAWLWGQTQGTRKRRWLAARKGRAVPPTTSPRVW